MRRAIILLLLFLGMQAVLSLGSALAGSQTLLSFGFLILAAYTVGEIAEAARLPKIVGYIVAGIVFGPDVFATISRAQVEELDPVSRLAIALIAFLAGAELQWKEVRERGTTIIKIMTAELGLTFVLVFALLAGLVAFDLIPFLVGTPLGEAMAFVLLFAAIAIVHSPAVTMALLTETQARGPVARTTLGIVLVSDVAVVLLFSAALAIARVIAPPPGGGEAVSLGMLTWEIGGAFVVGGVLGAVIALYLRFVQRELFMFGIVVVFLGGEIAALAHVETLLTLLVAGFVTENITPGGHGEELRHAMERAAAPVFVVFFALAGAAMSLPAVANFWPLVIPIVLVRTLGIWGGTVLGARWAKASEPERRYVWPGLISQAGVAIGLAALIAEAYPERGALLATLFLATLAVNQTAGPILHRQAIVRSGELPSEEPETPPGVPEPAPTPRVAG